MIFKSLIRPMFKRRDDVPHAELLRVQEEVALFNDYASDTIYRLRYGTMRYDYISPSVVRLLGYTSNELKDMNIRSLILETRIVSDRFEPVEDFEPLEEQRERGEVRKWQADYRMQTRDGRTIWVSDISYPWFDEMGAIIGSVGSLRDITARVEAEERARAEIERIGNTDHLTGLPNRRAFFTRLEDELKRARRSDQHLALLLIDIDHFRKVNNDYGNRTGDLMIQAIAKLALTCLRETDSIARVGGEEFAAILPDTPASGAYWVAERIRATVANHIFEFDHDEHLMGCTVSIGIAGAEPAEPQDANALYAEADRRLFIAKQTGRNRVSIDELIEAEVA